MKLPDGGLVQWRPFPGYKLRCGGLVAASVPSPEVVALTICGCLGWALPLKFTAGLHHPIRHFDTGLKTSMHGFLNVFVAGVLAVARQLTADQVREIIEDKEPSNFVFDDKELRWKTLRASTKQITAARRKAIISFGSCSFDEFHI